MRRNFFPIKRIVVAIVFLLICLRSQISAQVPESKVLFKERFSLYAHVLKEQPTRLPDAQTLQKRFSFFVNRERDCFEYDAATELAYELDARLVSLADVTLLIDRTSEIIIHKITEPYENNQPTIDTVGLKIQYMMLFLAAIFQNDRECGRCIFETYIKIIGLDTDDDVEIMKNHERVAP